MLRTLLAQKTDEPLDREKIRASLRALYATGRFATLQVEAEPARRTGFADLCRYRELLQRRGQRGRDAAKGRIPKPHQLVAVQPSSIWEMYSREEKVDRSVDRMKKVMADNGYYKATITYELEAESRRHTPDGDTFSRGPGRVGAGG